MEFTGNAREQDLTSEIDLLCDSDSTSYPLKHKVRRTNSALEELVGKIINADGTWQFDDTNHTTHPRGKGTLIEGQEDYSFSSEYLQIEAIDILNTSTQYKRIRPLDHQELNGLSPSEYFGVDSDGNPSKGFPEFFDQRGDTVRLYRAPTSDSVTLTDGLRVWFKRTILLYTMIDDTTMTSGHASREPGIPSPYHLLVAYMVSLPYCQSYKKDRVRDYQIKIGSDDPANPFYGGMTKDLLEHYAYREKAKVKRIIGSSISFR